MNRKIRYEVREYTMEVNEETVISYGINCVSEGESIAEVADISTDRKAVEELARTCGELELDPSQLKDVAEDFLA